MANESAFYSLEHMGTTSPNVSEITPPVRSDASSIEGKERRPTPTHSVSNDKHNLTFFSRVHRVQREIEAGRTVPDADLLQHSADLRQLISREWNCFLDTNDQRAFERFLKRQRELDATRRLLSRDWLDQFELMTFGDLADQDMRSK